MSRKLHRYDQEFKVQAVKLVQETGSCEKVAEELDIPAVYCTGGAEPMKNESGLFPNSLI